MVEKSSKAALFPDRLRRCIIGSRTQVIREERCREAGEPERARAQLRVARRVLEAFREDVPFEGRATVWEYLQDWYGQIETWLSAQE